MNVIKFDYSWNSFHYYVYMYGTPIPSIVISPCRREETKGRKVRPSSAAKPWRVGRMLQYIYIYILELFFREFPRSRHKFHNFTEMKNRAHCLEERTCLHFASEALTVLLHYLSKNNTCPWWEWEVIVGSVSPRCSSPFNVF